MLSSTAIFAQASVTGIEYKAIGCPDGSVKVAVASNGEIFSILYDGFNLQVDQGLNRTIAGCRVVLHIKKQRDLGLQIEGAEFRGFVALDSGVTTSQHI